MGQGYLRNATRADAERTNRRNTAEEHRIARRRKITIGENREIEHHNRTKSGASLKNATAQLITFQLLLKVRFSAAPSNDGSGKAVIGALGFYNASQLIA